MDETTTALAGAIGDRVRAERQARRWTLDQLADSAGVSRRMVVNVEQGTANPSLGTLLRLADALGVGLPTLVEPPRAAAMTVVRSGAAAVLWSSPAGGHGRLVASVGQPDARELWDWTLAPGDEHRSDGHRVGTTELLQVREGSVEIRVGEQTARLGVGDAVAFPGDVDHSYANAGTTPARFSLAVFEPGAGTASRPASPDGTRP